jgi:hypothetical protein
MQDGACVQERVLQEGAVDKRVLQAGAVDNSVGCGHAVCTTVWVCRAGAVAGCRKARVSAWVADRHRCLCCATACFTLALRAEVWVCTVGVRCCLCKGAGCKKARAAVWVVNRRCVQQCVVCCCVRAGCMKARTRAWVADRRCCLCVQTCVGVYCGRLVRCCVRVRIAGRRVEERGLQEGACKSVGGNRRCCGVLQAGAFV